MDNGTWGMKRSPPLFDSSKSAVPSDHHPPITTVLSEHHLHSSRPITTVPSEHHIPITTVPSEHHTPITTVPSEHHTPITTVPSEHHPPRPPHITTVPSEHYLHSSQPIIIVPTENYSHSFPPIITVLSEHNLNNSPPIITVLSEHNLNKSPPIKNTSPTLYTPYTSYSLCKDTLCLRAPRLQTHSSCNSTKDKHYISNGFFFQSLYEDSSPHSEDSSPHNIDSSPHIKDCSPHTGKPSREHNVHLSTFCSKLYRHNHSNFIQKNVSCNSFCENGNFSSYNVVVDEPSSSDVCIGECSKQTQNPHRGTHRSRCNVSNVMLRRISIHQYILSCFTIWLSSEILKAMISTQILSSTLSSLRLLSSKKIPSKQVHKNTHIPRITGLAWLYIVLVTTIQPILTSAQQTDEVGFFNSLFPGQCIHNGIPATCSFIMTCFMRGDTPVNKCGGSYVYTCCVPSDANVRSDPVRNGAHGHGRQHSDFNTVWGSPFKTFKDYKSPRPSGRRPLLPPPWEANLLSPPAVRVGPVFPQQQLSPARFPAQHSVETRQLAKNYYNEPECGLQRTSQFSKRIIGGNEAGFGEFPWQAHIRISGYQCGGVLVNHLFVATAAHCVHKARLDQITIHLGEFDTKDTGEYQEPFPKETFSVIEKRLHPSFKYMLTQPDRFDVAVLRLSRPVMYRPNIVPICLPEPQDDFTGTVGIVAGWGKTDNSFGKTGTNILRKVLVPIIENDECLTWHHLKGIDVKLHYEMFCAGHADGKMDACLGDSGGPLVVHNTNGRWTLAGITSAGFGCAVDHQPGIYHKVSVTSGWIAANIRP